MEKIVQDPSLNQRSGNNMQRTDPPTPRPKNLYPGNWGGGGRGVKIEKSIGGQFVSQNDDFTRP